MTGQQQSPIDIQQSIRVPHLTDQLGIRWAPGPQDFEVKKKQYGYRFKPHDGDQSVCLGAEVFTLAEVHFHRPSEHWVDGRRFDAELHAVHVRGTGDNVQRCAVGVFLSIEDCDRDVAEPPKSINLTGLLPQDRAFYRYEGSLTTPDYGERVSWVVMKDPVFVTDPALRKFILAAADDVRDAYPLNRRFVLSAP